MNAEQTVLFSHYQGRRTMNGLQIAISICSMAEMDDVTNKLLAISEDLRIDASNLDYMDPILFAEIRRIAMMRQSEDLHTDLLLSDRVRDQMKRYSAPELSIFQSGQWYSP